MLSDRPDIDPDAIFSPFDLARRLSVIAAVSGGSDSLAMLLLLQRWLERHAPHSRLVAITVDHGLRAASTTEAAAVAAFCGARRIHHRTAAWTGEKPRTGLSVAARLARYHLLAQAASAENSDIIVTGHTADDQAETVAMRQARGDGRGLAGMAPATLFDGRSWIVRPLLSVGRNELRSFLRNEGVAWIDDPTNVETAYERARVRRELQDAGDRTKDLLQMAQRAGAGRLDRGREAAALIDLHADCPLPGLVFLSSGFAAAAQSEAALLALRAVLAVVGGVEHLPDADRAAAVLHRLSGGPFRATLSRAVVDARKAGVFVYRERRGLPEGPAVPGMLWDSRYEIVAAGADASVFAKGREFPPEDVDEQGRADKETLQRLGGTAVPHSIARAARATMPQLGSPALVAVPVLAPWRRFLPSFEFELAHTVTTLVGGAKIPAPPLVGHNGQEG